MSKTSNKRDLSERLFGGSLEIGTIIFLLKNSEASRLNKFTIFSPRHLTFTPLKKSAIDSITLISHCEPLYRFKLDKNMVKASLSQSL